MDDEVMTNQRPEPYFPAVEAGMCPDVFPHYDREGDHLRLSFRPTPVPAYSLPVRDYVAFRVDIETGEIVGMEIERFLARAVKKVPELQPLAAFAAPQRRSIDPRSKPKKPEREQVGAIVHRLRPQPA